MKYDAAFGVAYLFMVAFMPYISLLGQKVRIELLLFVPVLAYVVANYKSIVTWKAEVCLASALLLLALIVFTSISILLGHEINAVGVFFYIRYFVLVAFVSVIGDSLSGYGKYFVVVVVVLALASFMQFLGLTWFIGLIEKIYSSPTRTSGLAGLSNLSVSGFSMRSYGILESPTWSGVFFGLSLYYSYFQNKWLSLLCGVSSLIGGMLSVSSSFFALMSFVFAFYFWQKRSVKPVIVLCAVLIAACAIAVNFFDQDMLNAIMYQIDRLVTLSVFDTRYSGSGNIGANFTFDLLGKGSVVEMESLIGDSLYLVLLHDFGIFFGFIFVVYLLYAFLKIGGRRGVAAWGLLIAAGFGSASFFSPRIADLFLIATAMTRGEK